MGRPFSCTASATRRCPSSTFTRTAATTGPSRASLRTSSITRSTSPRPSGERTPRSPAPLLARFRTSGAMRSSGICVSQERRVKRLEVEPTKLVLYFDEILEGETIELEAETVSPVANLQPTSSIVYEYYQPENQALAISRSDDSSGTFVREKAVDAEEAIDGRQIIDSAAGALAPNLFSAAAGAGIALMALV